MYQRLEDLVECKKDYLFSYDFVFVLLGLSCATLVSTRSSPVGGRDTSEWTARWVETSGLWVMVGSVYWYERIKFTENLVFVLRIEIDGGCALFRSTCIAPPWLCKFYTGYVMPSPLILCTPYHLRFSIFPMAKRKNPTLCAGTLVTHGGPFSIEESTGRVLRRRLRRREREGGTWNSTVPSKEPLWSPFCRRETKSLK